MARLVKRFRSQPYSVTFNGETKSVCGCGLSATQPFCDGTHLITGGEDPDKLCWYDETKQRFLVADDYANMRSEKLAQEV